MSIVFNHGVIVSVLGKRTGEFVKKYKCLDNSNCS